MLCVGCQIAVNFHGADCLSFCRKLLIFRKDLSTLFALYNKMYLMGLNFRYLGETRALGTFQEKLTYWTRKQWCPCHRTFHYPGQ